MILARFPAPALAVALGLAALAAVMPPVSPARAQAQMTSDQALQQLAEILGALSYLEPLCELDARSRTDMERVLGSEALSDVRQSVLIDAFNRGFRAVANTHQRCTSGSLRLVDLHHERGAAIIDQLLDG
jgi:uncharacterized protein (TIGR02301 family)